MNKRLFLKMSLATLSVLALFSQSVLAEENIHFSSCKEAWANGYSDLHEGDPGYSAKLDRDHDGVACELKNAPKGKILKSDINIAKNYLTEKELKDLEEIVSMYLDYAENQAKRKIFTQKKNSHKM